MHAQPYQLILSWDSVRTVLRCCFAGASTGHGLLLSSQFAACGASVAMVARGQERLHKAAATVTGAPVHAITGDLADTQSIQNAADSALQQLGGLDVVVISAANSTPEYLDKHAVHSDLHRVHVQGTDTLIKVPFHLDTCIRSRVMEKPTSPGQHACVLNSRPTFFRHPPSRPHLRPNAAYSHTTQRHSPPSRVPASSACMHKRPAGSRPRRRR